MRKDKEIRKKKILDAVNLSIKVWKELAERGTDYKEDISFELWKQIRDLKSHCPLCGIFSFDEVNKDSERCEGCPLAVVVSEKRLTCFNTGSPFQNWYLSAKPSDRKCMAQIVVNTLTEWKEKTS